MLIFRRTHPIHAACITVTLYESSWWPVGTQLEWELCTDWPPWTLVDSDSTMCCMYTMYPSEDEHLWLETCIGIIYLCGTSQCVVNIKLVQLTVNHTQNKTLVTVLFEQQWARSYMFQLMTAIIRRTNTVQVRRREYNCQLPYIYRTVDSCTLFFLLVPYLYAWW